MGVAAELGVEPVDEAAGEVVVDVAADAPLVAAFGVVGSAEFPRFFDEVGERLVVFDPFDVAAPDFVVEDGAGEAFGVAYAAELFA